VVSPLIVLAAAGLTARVLGVFGDGFGASLLDLLLAAGLVVFLIQVRRRRALRARPRPPDQVPDGIDLPSGRTSALEQPRAESSLDLGVREIRRTDPGFDPSRFVGYAGMLFRDAHHAWMTDLGTLRDRVTPHIYGELQRWWDQLQNIGHAYRAEDIEVTAEVTEAWQESGCDYVTAYIGGSMVEYTVDAANDRLMSGARTLPRAVEEFWTFTRQAGLNFWMLSAIQTS
jgi:predicted lipid-binding transport protein (Tim44 family)